MKPEQEAEAKQLFLDLLVALEKYVRAVATTIPEIKSRGQVEHLSKRRKEFVQTLLDLEKRGK